MEAPLDTVIIGAGQAGLALGYHLQRPAAGSPKAVDGDGDDLVLTDGSRRTADAVVWATGFRPSYPWLHVPVLDESGAPIHYRGITDAPGLAFLGLPWQRNRGSALLGWVGRDAAILAERLGGQLGSSGSTRGSRPVAVGA